jgi:4-amino-4-deoxy-L-arabinose transferase-like glycosyltransferase
MAVFALRIYTFSVLPLLLAGAVIVLDTSVSSRERKLEVLLVFLFALSVAGGGIGNFFAHFFLSDQVAESIGWPTGSPFQREVAFANLALGVLGLVAVGRRDGFREATVIAVTVFGVGATIVHIMDIAATGNLAPGNTLQNVLNLARPALLIGILAMARRAEAAPGSESGTEEFDRWRAPLAQAAGLATACVATAFGIAYAVNHPILITLLGTAIGFAVVMVTLLRAPQHHIRGVQGGEIGM